MDEKTAKAMLLWLKIVAALLAVLIACSLYFGSMLIQTLDMGIQVYPQTA